MAFKGQKKKDYMTKYNPEYYKENKDKILEYRKTRRLKDNENWRVWYAKQKDKIRKQKIYYEKIYKPFNPYDHS